MAAYVYFIKCGDYCKIGYTRCPIKSRLSGIQTGSPYKAKLLATITLERISLGDDLSDYLARDVEHSFHTLFMDYHQTREWFWYKPVERFLNIGHEDKLRYIEDFIRAADVNKWDVYTENLRELAQYRIDKELRHDIP